MHAPYEKEASHAAFSTPDASISTLDCKGWRTGLVSGGVWGYLEEINRSDW